MTIHTSRSFRFTRSLTLATGCFGTCTLAWAGGNVVFDDFSDTTGLVLNGSAAATTTGDGEIMRLTQAQAWEAGSVFSDTQVDASDFSTMFSFRISAPGGAIFAPNTEAGADGFVFVVQPISSSLGASGGGIGYQGIGTSLGIEFDTWNNNKFSDPSQSHVAINLNGDVAHTGLPTAGVFAPELDDSDRWWVWIDYDGSELQIRLRRNDTRPVNALITHTLDLPTIMGQNTAFVGFTSATGAAWANHDIIDWSYTPFVAPPCPADINNDGDLNFFDVSEFLQLFDNQDPIADFNADDFWNFFDISAFLTAFADGCP